MTVAKRIPLSSCLAYRNPEENQSFGEMLPCLLVVADGFVKPAASDVIVSLFLSTALKMQAGNSFGKKSEIVYSMQRPSVRFEPSSPSL
jgi:hypothetical protein